MGTDTAMRLLLGHCGARFCLVDVGARWGAHHRWSSLNERADILCFDPDAEECARLTASSPANVRYYPFGLSDVDGTCDLHVTEEPACSSLYPPVPALHEHYPALAIIKPLRTVRIPCRRLDDVLAEQGIDRVAAIKLDTQGSELAVLKGATRALLTCSIVDVEVEFNELYRGQGLFCDVDRFLRDNGFVLWRFENLVHYAEKMVAAAQVELLVASDPAPAQTFKVPNGQVFWAQAQYVRAEYPRTGAAQLPAEVALPAAILAGTYGLWDLALELVRKTGDAALLGGLRDELGLAAG